MVFNFLFRKFCSISTCPPGPARDATWNKQNRHVIMTDEDTSPHTWNRLHRQFDWQNKYELQGKLGLTPTCIIHRYATWYTPYLNLTGHTGFNCTLRGKLNIEWPLLWKFAHTFYPAGDCYPFCSDNCGDYRVEKTRNKNIARIAYWAYVRPKEWSLVHAW